MDIRSSMSVSENIVSFAWGFISSMCFLMSVKPNSSPSENSSVSIWSFLFELNFPLVEPLYHSCSQSPLSVSWHLQSNAVYPFGQVGYWVWLLFQSIFEI